MTIDSNIRKVFCKSDEIFEVIKLLCIKFLFREIIEKIFIKLRKDIGIVAKININSSCCKYCCKPNKKAVLQGLKTKQYSDFSKIMVPMTGASTISMKISRLIN